MRAAVIYNPQASQSTALPDAAIAVFREEGWSVEALQTAKTGDAIRLARAAATGGAEAVFAAGGDGTVNEVANGLFGTETALGVLPVGMANVWAREMGLPLGSLAQAARDQATASARWIDVGEVSGPEIVPRIFLLWSGIGFDAHITAEVERQPQQKRRLGPLWFGAVGLRAAFGFRGRPVVLRIDGKPVRGRFILLLASNAQLYGGVVRIAPAAALDDGQLDLMGFRGTGTLRTAWHVLRVLFGRHLNAPDVAYWQAQEIEIHAKRMPVHVDAEPVGRAPVRIRVCPRSLRVLVPANANPRLFTKPADLK